MLVLKQIFTNAYLWLPLLTGIGVQLFKFVYHWVVERTPNFEWLVTTGGMPSSHSASVTALSTLVGLRQGFDSPLFGVTLYFSLIVMYDAAGLRRAAGKQAAVINRMLQAFSRFHRIEDAHLRELLGHSPTEVFVGALLGVLVALVFEGLHG